MAVVFTLVVGRKILRLESRVFGGRGVMESGEARANGGKREEGKGNGGMEREGKKGKGWEWKGRDGKSEGEGNEGKRRQGRENKQKREWKGKERL